MVGGIDAVNARDAACVVILPRMRRLINQKGQKYAGETLQKATLTSRGAPAGEAVGFHIKGLEKFRPEDGVAENPFAESP
jgi:hypothetical protein